MIDAFYLCALVCALASAWIGARTSWALLASAGMTSLLWLVSVPFNPFLWAAIDLAVIAAIWLLKRNKGGPSVTDILIFVLFIPIWGLYAADRPYAGAGVNLIASVQMLLAAPFKSLWATYHRNAASHPDRWNEFDLRAAPDAA